MTFLLQSLISRSFFVLRRYTLFFLHLFIWWYLLQIFPGSNFLLLQVFCFFRDLVVLFLCYLFFPPFIMSMAHFSMPNSILIYWLYILLVCTKVPNSFSFFAKSLMSSKSIKCSIFSCHFVNLLLLPGHFLRI